MNTKSCLKLLLVSTFLISTAHLNAKETQDAKFEIRFEKHRFDPQLLVVPTGRPLRIKVVNSSADRIEFESFKLNREIVVDPGETVTVDLPPLKAGTYDFFDDFHNDVPEGEIVAR